MLQTCWNFFLFYWQQQALLSHPHMICCMGKAKKCTTQEDAKLFCDHDDRRQAYSTCLNAGMMSFDNSISLNIPSSLLVKPPPHSETE